METEQNIYETAARNLKAAKLAVVLTRSKCYGGVSIDFIDWRAASILAGVNPPSTETKELVMELCSVGR